jgi:hypothetical protein
VGRWPGHQWQGTALYYAKLWAGGPVIHRASFRAKRSCGGWPRSQSNLQQRWGAPGPGPSPLGTGEGCRPRLRPSRLNPNPRTHPSGHILTVHEKRASDTRRPRRDRQIHNPPNDRDRHHSNPILFGRTLKSSLMVCPVQFRKAAPSFESGKITRKIIVEKIGFAVSVSN